MRESQGIREPFLFSIWFKTILKYNNYFSSYIDTVMFSEKKKSPKWTQVVKTNWGEVIFQDGENKVSNAGR